jgi:hypothetical protein
LNISLRDIVISDQLAKRIPREVDVGAENAAYLSVVAQLGNDPKLILQALSDAALTLCRAGTSGVSMLETDASGEQVFRWTVLSGALQGNVGGTTPRNFSPCGVCLDCGEPVLFDRPDRLFTYFQASGAPFVEGLVLPFSVDGRVTGTIWVVTHEEGRRFDREDVRVMSRLAEFASLVYDSTARSLQSS